MPFFTQEDIETGNWKNRTEELMAMVNLYRSKNEELKADNETLEEKITCLESDSHNEVSLAEYEELQEENEKLKENEEGIMDFIVSGSGLGCNSYEKFINLSSELEYSEELITKLKKENEEQLAAVECLKFMDYTYKDGRWMMDGEEEDEEEED